jgi:hypothetical protein
VDNLRSPAATTARFSSPAATGASAPIPSVFFSRGGQGCLLLFHVVRAAWEGSGVSVLFFQVGLAIAIQF